MLGTMVRQQSPAQLMVDPEDTAHGGGSRHIFVVPLLNFPGLSFQLSIVAPGPGLVITTAPLLLTIA